MGSKAAILIRIMVRPAVLCLALLAAAPGRADVFLDDMWDNGLVTPGTMVFPNWSRVWAGSFVAEFCEGCTDPDPTEILKGLTVANFGTALPADIANVYWLMSCNGTKTTFLMTYAGNYAEDTGAYHAWTWAGSTINLAGCNPLCVGCLAAAVQIDLYVDIAPCPTDGVSINLGFPYHGLSNTMWGGSVTDQHGTAVPWDDLPGGDMTVVHVLKDSDKDTVVPGDTVTYTIFYGRPGTGPLTAIEVFDTMPTYTHYVMGSGAPPPDVAWGQPATGPPQTLKWSFPGPLATTGGPTGMITFQVTVDWGNGEVFEPGSGDVAAPEGPGLNNSVNAAFSASGCAPSAWSATTGATVRRYLFWKLGDNDVLFAGRPGMPDDEMIYSIFVKNMSATKTWWDTQIWDTVPTQLDVWGAGYGIDDPCAGWTMTPGGCAAASPGYVVGGGRTMLTWNLDLPPQATVELKWKARVVTTVAAGSTAINRVAIQEMGRSGIIGGTGNAGRPRVFTHEARIVLRTTYLSYVGVTAEGWGCSPFLIFFPLSKATDFELRGLEYDGAVPFAVSGGVSASIGPLIGTCLGGLVCPASTGCAVERAPTHYSRWTLGCAPNSGQPVCPTYPFHFLYKLVSNAPVLWTYFPDAETAFDDGHTFTPATSLSFSGLMHYTYLRENAADPIVSDALNIMNTSLDVDGVFNAALDTTVHIFRWNTGSKAWDYWDTYEIDPESQAARPPVDPGDEGYFRIVSSQTKLVIHQWANGGAQVYNHLSPNRETGAMTSKSGAGYTFYVFPGKENDYDRQVGVTNVGPTTATYRIEWYRPRRPFPAPTNVSPWQADTSGSWLAGPTDTVTPGLTTCCGPTGNAHGYGPPYDPGYAFKTPNADMGIWRIVQLAGGPLQVVSGAHFMGMFGGSVLHATDGNQTGQEFWVTQYQTLGYKGAKATWPFAIDVFCPKTGMAVRAVTGDGVQDTYTTGGPDQCVMFNGFTAISNNTKRNIRINLLAGGAQGNMLAMYIHYTDAQRMYTAPFMSIGVHYDILIPPVVYIGQSVWLTVVVVDAAGGTKVDYCGTTTFTSTDPGAKIQNTAMDIYNYTWSSVSGACGSAPYDDGVRLFVNVFFTRLGTQTIIASDTVDGSIIGLAATLVVGVDVKLFKEPRFTSGASGDTVSFRVCWSNYSSSSAFTFVITDAVPMGTTFVPEAGTAALDCGNTGGVAPAVAYSQATSVTPPAAFTSANPTNAPSPTRWLRWTIPSVGVNTTGCVCYRVTVN